MDFRQAGLKYRLDLKKGVDHPSVELLVALFSNFGARIGHWPGGLIRSLVGQRIEDIGHRNDPPNQRYICAR